MGNTKNFSVASFLKEKKGDSPQPEQAAEPAPEPSATRLSPDVTSPPIASPSTSGDEGVTIVAETEPSSPPTANVPDAAPPLLAVVDSRIAREEEARKKPGPKPRDYIKRSIGVALHLDEFVEDARRTHVRPDGTRSTLYSHFVEDLIAAELARRRSR